MGPLMIVGLCDRGKKGEQPSRRGKGREPMDSKVFTYFEAVERHRNYSRAAGELYLSPQGLNAAMRRLESDLGVPLFDVKRGSVELTEYGQCFSRYAHTIGSCLSAMRTEINDIAARKSNSIRLGCSMGVLGYLGDDIIARFNAAHAGASVFVEELPDYQCERNMLEGKYDYALVINPIDHPDLIAWNLCSDYQFCWVKNDDALACRSELSMEDLDGRSIMTVGEGYKNTSALLELCATASVHPCIKYSSEMMRIYEFARSGEGIGITCRNHVERTPSNAVVGIPLRCLPWGFSICHKRGRVPLDVDTAFVSFMKTLRRTYR